MHVPRQLSLYKLKSHYSQTASTEMLRTVLTCWLDNPSLKKWTDTFKVISKVSTGSCVLWKFRNGQNILSWKQTITLAAFWEYSIWTWKRRTNLLGEKKNFSGLHKAMWLTPQQHLFYSFRNLSSLVSRHKDLILITLKLLKDNALCGSVHTIQGRTI